MLENKLIQIGLKANQAKVYLELFKIGPQVVSILAKRLGLNRTTVYNILKELNLKGFISSYNEGNLRVFVANDPSCVLAYLDRKAKVYQYYRQDFLTVMDDVRDLAIDCDFEKPKVSYCDGIENVKQVLYDVFNERECVAYLALQKCLSFDFKSFFAECAGTKFFQAQSSVRALLPSDKRVKDLVEEFYPLGQMDFVAVDLAEHGNIFENMTYICDRKVVMVGLDEGEEYSVVIEDDGIAKMHKKMFELNWKYFNR